MEVLVFIPLLRSLQTLWDFTFLGHDGSDVQHVQGLNLGQFQGCDTAPMGGEGSGDLGALVGEGGVHWL